ncbi:Asparagine synthetase [Minicystis rosea]|nr:Asparagine synthetase [Minicystis rosea]
MCGIFGYLSDAADLDEARTLATAQEALRHRGPDDRGTHRATKGDLRIGLAHTRLAIIDLSPGGHQPVSTGDGRYTLVYNGEVYNFRELREELEGLGATFRSSCDTEVVLEAYARWGRGALTRFRGMFAIAVWDAHEGTLFLARDRLGIKPLYYTRGPRGFAFASEIRALLATGFAERRLSRRALQSYFAFGAVSDPDVILDGVTSLAPGSWALLKDGKLETRAYWSLPLTNERDAAFADEARSIEPILQEAVSLRLIADVPIGVFLSGGIDSSVVVALATRASSTPVHTFTVTFDEERYSEAPYAAEVARRYGCDHHQVHLPASRAVLHFGDAIRALDQPSVDGVNTYFVSKAARAAGLTVALSGLGGDEVFAGYSYFRAFGPLRALARTAGRLPPPLHRGLGLAGGASGLPVQVRKLSALLAGDGSAAAVYAAQRAMFTPEERRVLLVDGIEDPAYLGVTAPSEIDPRLASGKLDPVNAYSALELSNYLRHTLLRDTDVMSMAHGLEVRVPLIDHVLLERVMRIPGALKIGPNGNKPLLTATVPTLPDSAVNRQKMGFTLPYEAWFRGPLRPWVEELLLGSTMRKLGFLQVQGVERLWRSFLKGDRYTNYARVWCVAALAGWCDANGVG